MENTDVDQNGSVTISDVTCLIDYLLSGKWPQAEPHKQTYTVAGVSFTMVTVEGGTFTMGATAEQGTVDPQEDEYPTHEVTLSTFSIGETEVTQELWMAVMSELAEQLGTAAVHNPSQYSSACGYPDDFRRPVESLDYSDVLNFVTAISYLSGLNFRLPTEAEWEFAARGGNLSKGYKYAGSDDIDEVGWYYANVPGEIMTQPVAQKKPNELGLYDMSGNVWEWCQDRYAPYSSEPQVNPVVTVGRSAITRGGSHGDRLGRLRVSGRFTAWLSNSTTGLRLVLSEE